jgi:two-component system OmpR family response regulator
MRVLLLESDVAKGAGIIERLHACGHTVNWCRRLADVIRLGEQTHDALLVALQLPDGSGIDWVAALRRRGDATPLLMLTDQCQPVDLSRASGTSADERAAQDSVLSTIRSALSREPFVDRPWRAFGHIELDLLGRRALVRGCCVALTDREWDVLTALTQSAGRLVAKRDLESKVMGPASATCSNAIEVHVSSLRRKLGRSFIETVRGLGYRIST